jgi:D-3-phosphoglycerate dehydrogenase / 2-oxoglutarate reductase
MSDAGKWIRGSSSPMMDRRKCVSTLARCSARRATAFSLDVIAYRFHPVTEMEITGDGVEPVGFGVLLEGSDFASIRNPRHVELERALNASAPTVMARGSIIDEQALVRGLQDGTIAGAGPDVLEQQPPEADSQLLTMPNVVMSAHVASASTRMRPECMGRMGLNPAVLLRASLERWQPYPTNRGPNR